MNHVVITGQLVECSALRYTPSGVPVIEFKLFHDQQIEQAGIKRQVMCEIGVVVVGDLAMMWRELTLGQVLDVEGFLAATRKGSSKLLLNATGIRISDQNTN